MTTAVRPSFTFDNTYVRDLDGLYERWSAAQAPNPRLIALNEQLARELGLDQDALRTDEGVGVLVGNVVPEGAEPIAQAYAGHQFGGYSPRLGDGRALLVGELIDPKGARHDIHLKGSGRTRFARGGDGKAPLGPMLREYVVGEAMHALRIPTTRALAVTATGEMIMRDRGPEPGAVLARVASSHLRVGTFQYTAATGDVELLKRLADYAIDRHHPDARDADNPYLAFYERVVEAQAYLVAQWMLVGFVHGVMNTDNMTISGETIDYGPCAFLDGFDPATVYSSIDEGGRYAYGNQPVVAAWNLARFAETLIPLIDPDADAAVAAATEVLQSFTDRHAAHWRAGMRAKLGLERDAPEDPSLIEDLATVLRDEWIDHTRFYRALAHAVRGDDAPVRDLFSKPEAFDAWAARWRAALPSGDRGEIAAGMDRVNPVYIPRNHLVEEALTAAVAGDFDPFHRLNEVLADPFVERPGLERYTEPGSGGYTTFCGT
ncbi:protein adenylyltransferase SelO [Pseudonocardia endophytica]|uniref:Protein nucleotidyltransferase YdiU n=1 Tax=Pseudonocardia endophytica TaxID=401976 RepID=A0A4R1HK27_PSEEN|nr:YdiU family protein [Pseudonocardia endophytica]TCK22707.1 uncharacterized protein YdiU (UPF0061 family) [Pseudonocardia endophytica]